MPAPERQLKYCLDAQLSYRVAKALQLVGWPVVHVSEVPELQQADTVAGQCRAEDPDIAAWCARQGRTLITSDEDFRGRWVRSGELEKHGVEVIVFERELAGLQKQHERITAQMPVWGRTLGPYPPGHRVWVQGEKRQPRLQEGLRRRRRSRG